MKEIFSNPFMSICVMSLIYVRVQDPVSLTICMHDQKTSFSCVSQQILLMLKFSNQYSA